MNILVSVVFSGMSGSAIADAAGPGQVMIKQMLKRPEYSPGFAGAVVVASATIGPIIPPSIPLVIYGLVSGTLGRRAVPRRRRAGAADGGAC